MISTIRSRFRALSLIDRRNVTLGMGSTLMAASVGPTFAAPASADFERRLSLVTEHEKLEGLHALLVSQHGKIVFEHYQPGKDRARSGQDLGVVAFGPDVPHDLRSVSKSVVGLLYGIALADGKVAPPEAQLYAQFPEYSDLAAQPGRDALTVAHALSMTMGLQWDEMTAPYGDPRNSENAMDAAPDRYRYILSLPLVDKPGTKWTYCGGATALLAHLISRGTGQPLLQYARHKLFDPMGFGPSDWAKGRNDEPYAASGLRLLPRDMLKIGELVLAHGIWQGRQLVPAEWVNKITSPVIRIDHHRSYGYQWYMGEVAALGQTQTHHWIGGIGWGGQRLFVLPDLALVGAMNCGNYAKSGEEQSRITGTILVAVVLPLVS